MATAAATPASGMNTQHRLQVGRVSWQQVRPAQPAPQHAQAPAGPGSPLDPKLLGGRACRAQRAVAHRDQAHAGDALQVGNVVQLRVGTRADRAHPAGIGSGRQHRWREEVLAASAVAVAACANPLLRDDASLWWCCARSRNSLRECRTPALASRVRLLCPPAWSPPSSLLLKLLKLRNAGCVL